MSKLAEAEPLSSAQRWYRGTYLRSDHWRKVRAEKFKQAPLCYMCGDHRHLDVHHATYVRIGAEKLSDLLTLCRRCHSLEHEKLSFPEKVARERALMVLAAGRAQDVRALSKLRGRRRKTEAFVRYAFHCLRAIRHGVASPEELEFVRCNKHQISRLPV